ncbi:MAG: pyruvoyl-dependent arginine decarboxylase [Thermoplasmata archaeon]
MGEPEGMVPVPTRFFVTGAGAVSPVSDLNAFDKALIEAGIGEQNLVSVSSVLPPGIRQVNPKSLGPGLITYSVLAQMRGNEGEQISAGIAYAFRKDEGHGHVAEGHMYGTRAALQEILEWKIEEMARHRGIEFGKIQYRIQDLSVPMDHYGACVAALVFLR